jgi:hypothetical protein
MLINLLLGMSTMLLCLLLQIILLLAAMRYYRRREVRSGRPSFAGSLTATSSIMLLLVFGNLVQIAIWGSLFLYLGEFRQFADAFYHSAVNFATLGYGDHVMSDKHKLLGPLESVNGILMIGLSTSAIMGALQNSVRRTLQKKNNNNQQ